MERIVNYDPRLMMLYNLKPVVLVISQASNFDRNEENLLDKANEVINLKPELSLAMMNLETFKAMELGTYSSNTMVRLAVNHAKNLEYFINYFVGEVNQQKELFLNMKNLLNIQKVVINPEFVFGIEKVSLKALTKVFGEDNIIFEPYLEPGEKLKRTQLALANGNVKQYFIDNQSHFQIKGEVVHGKQLGRVLGFPTANIKYPRDSKLKKGVYYTKVKLPNDERLYEAMSSYWINEENESLVETYILDFNQDIYGWFIEVQFYDYIRDNVKVKDREELIKLLESDAAWVRKQTKKRKM